MSKFKKHYEGFYSEFTDIDKKEFKRMFKNGILKNRLIKNILRIFKERNIKTICDIGCGYGYITSFFSKKGFNVDGLDICEVRIKRAKKLNPGPNYYLHDAENKKLKKKYDAIYAFNLIEHIYEYDEFLKNIYKHLNKNGLVIISTPNALAPRIRFRVLFGIEKCFVSKTHIHFFTIKNLKEIFHNNGFKIYRIFGYGKLAFLSKNLSGNLCMIGIKNKLD